MEKCEKCGRDKILAEDGTHMVEFCGFCGPSPVFWIGEEVNVSMNVSCSCVDWKESMSQIIRAQNFEYIYGVVYTGAVFRFCPWCGEKLRKLEKLKNS
jgi:ribosomal protein S27AE